MPEETPSAPSPSPQSAPQPEGTPFHIGEEFGTARKSLPPAKIVLIGVIAVVVVAVFFAVVQRPHSSASGSIDDIGAVEMPNQNSVMVAINLSLHNGGEKPYWIHSIQAELDTDSGNFTDEAAPAVDFDRYFQALPALKEHALPALRREKMIEPNGDMKGTIIVSFPVVKDVFDTRKSLKVTIQPYDQPKPLVLSK
jgi:hypothetical protein